MLLISWFIGGALLFGVYSYLFSRMISKIKFKITVKNIIGIILMGVLNATLLASDIAYLKPYLMHIASFILLYWIYKEKWMKTIIGLLFVAMASFIAEFVLGLTIILILNINLNNSNNEILSYLLINIGISIITILISKIPFVKAFLNTIINWYNKNEYKSLIIFTFCTINFKCFHYVIIYSIIYKVP